MCKRGNRSQEGKVVFAEIMTENNFKSYETYKPIDKRRKTTDNLEFYTPKNVSFKKKGEISNRNTKFKKLTTKRHTTQKF